VTVIDSGQVVNTHVPLSSSII